MIGIQKLWWFVKTQFLRFSGIGIGWKTYIGGFSFIHGPTGITLGSKVRIFPGLRMETHLHGTIIIESDVSIGQNFHITSAEQELKIGSHTTISGNVFITNIDHQYQNIGQHIMSQDFLVKKTEIGENCFIGFGSAIQAGTILGKQCVVGANSVVRGVFPDYCVIVGSPAKIVKRYNPQTKMWERYNK